MFELLIQPFPNTTSYIKRIRTALIYGLFVFLFLAIFQPFGLANLPGNHLTITALGYGLVCFIVLSACFLLLPLGFRTFYSERSWTVWKEILHTLLCVSIVAAANIIFTHFWFHIPIKPPLIFQFLWNTFSVGILPITFITLFRQIRLMRVYSRQARELDRRLHSPTATDPTEPPKMPLPTLEKTLLSIPETESEFLYAESADNYTRIYSLENGSPVRKIIRSTLKALEEDLSAQPGIYRCHRTYLVNLRKVIRITGNAQGYKLHLEHVEEPIPVSRNLNKEIARLVDPYSLSQTPSQTSH